MTSRVCVTGAAGFIGSHLVELLVRHGHEVRALVRYNSRGSAGWLDTLDEAVRTSIDVHFGDLRDPALVLKAVRGCETVYHLGALISIPFSYEAAQLYVSTNILGTLHVLDACRQCNVSKLVHTSTSEVYGTPHAVPISEDFPLHAQSPYAATKIGADQLAMSYFLSFDVPVVILRPFNCYGPRQSVRAIIPTIITQLAHGQPSLRLGALAPTRDFTFVADTARAFHLAAQSQEAVGRITQVGTGYEISVGELARLIAGIMGKNVSVEEEDRRLRPEQSEVQRLCADASNAFSRFGWAPEHPGAEGLRRGLTETVAWFNDPANLRHYRQGSFQL